MFDKVPLQVGNRNFGAVENTRSQCAVDAGLDEYFEEMAHRARTARRNQRNIGDLANRGQLLAVIAAPAPRSWTSCTQSSVLRCAAVVLSGSPVYW